MGRSVYAEERLLEYLDSLGTAEACSVGLILGQSTEQKDFVVHLAKTLPTSNTKVVEETFTLPVTNSAQQSSNNSIKCIKDIDINLVADHAKQVTRMLPGGMWVLGIFIVSAEDCFSDTAKVQKFRSVLSAIYKNLSSNIYLYGNSSYENLILTYNSITKQYVCKSVETSTGGILKPADWKFQKKATKWHQLESILDLDQLFPILDEIRKHTLKRQFQEIIKEIANAISTALVVIEDEPKPSDELIEAIAKKKKSKKDKNEEEVEQVLQVGVYLPCVLKDEKESVKIISCGASMRLLGQLVSRTAVHQKASIQDATNAVKQDILRSLASRLELHYDSVIEEENGSPEENVTLHEPPRRVFVELPQNKVILSDYLFPGEGYQESLVILKELLDIDVLESQIQKDVERQVDPSDPLLYPQNETHGVTAEHDTETASTSHYPIYIVVMVISFIIAIAAILVHQLSSKKRE